MLNKLVGLSQLDSAIPINQIYMDATPKIVNKSEELAQSN